MSRRGGRGRLRGSRDVGRGRSIAPRTPLVADDSVELLLSAIDVLAIDFRVPARRGRLSEVGLILRRVHRGPLAFVLVVHGRVDTRSGARQPRGAPEISRARAVRGARRGYALGGATRWAARRIAASR